MRGLIRFSAGFFVVVGFIGFVLVALTVVSEFGGGDVGVGLAVALTGLVCAAAIVLVGGSTYMLTEIDIRLEEDRRVKRKAAGAAS